MALLSGRHFPDLSVDYLFKVVNGLFHGCQERTIELVSLINAIESYVLDIAVCAN